jgi:cytochrome c peroxidase
VLFLENALYETDLGRYVPSALPTGACFPVADEEGKADLNC